MKKRVYREQRRQVATPVERHRAHNLNIGTQREKERSNHFKHHSLQYTAMKRSLLRTSPKANV